jgi:hypothetical protein
VSPVYSGCFRPARRAQPPPPGRVRLGKKIDGRQLEPEIFLRRRGGTSLEDLRRWKHERTAEAARKLKEAGVNLVVTNFHKGFGLKAEAEDVETARRFVEHLHREGVRAGGYVGASMMWETFFAEEPAAAGWRQLDERGAPVPYPGRVSCSVTWRAATTRIPGLSEADADRREFH